jgi:hypothetical protein
MAKKNNTKPKNESVLAKVKLFFEEIPESRSKKAKQVPSRTLKRSKKR